MSVEITNEPPPPPKKGVETSGGAHILVVEEKTGKVVNEIFTPHYAMNEKRLRESTKY